MKINIIISDVTKIGSFKKAEKKIWITPTSKRKGHYRKIVGAKGVEEKHSQLISGFKDMIYSESKKIPTKKEFYSQEYWHDPNYGKHPASGSGKLPKYEVASLEVRNVGNEPAIRIYNPYTKKEIWYYDLKQMNEAKERFKNLYDETFSKVKEEDNFISEKISKENATKFFDEFCGSPEEVKFIGKINKGEKVMENYYYTYEKNREFIKVSGIGNDPHNMDYIKWEASDGAKGILKQLDEIKTGYAPSIGFVEYKKYPNDIYIQISRFGSIYKDGWRFSDSNLPDESDVGKMTSTKRVYVKPSKRAKGYYREQKVGREEIDPKIINLWKIPRDKFIRLISGDKILLKEKYIEENSYTLGQSHPKLEYLISLMTPEKREWKTANPVSFPGGDVTPHSQAIFQALGAHEKVPLHVLKDYPEAAYSYEIDITDEALEQEPPQGKIEHLYEMPKDQYDAIIVEVKKDYNRDPNKVTDSMLNNKYPEELADIKAAAKLRKKIFNNLPKQFRYGFTPETMNGLLHKEFVLYVSKSLDIPDDVKAGYPQYFANIPFTYSATGDKNNDDIINNILGKIRDKCGNNLNEIDKIVSNIIGSSGKPVLIEFKNMSLGEERLVKIAMDDVSKLIGKDLLDKINKCDPIPITYNKDKIRAHGGEDIMLAAGDISVEQDDYNDEVITHEYGHSIEYMIPEISDAARKFRNKRTDGEKVVRFVDTFPHMGYDPWEETQIDHFMTAYIGKIYPEATEVLSTGIAFLTTKESTQRMYKEDPEYFGLILAMLSGRIKLNDKKESL